MLDTADSLVARPPVRAAVDALDLRWPRPVAEMITAIILLSIGTCIRGKVLIELGLPITMAGFACAWVAMWNLRRAGVLNPSRVVTLGLTAMALTGVLGSLTVGGWTYDGLKRAYFLVALVAMWVWTTQDERRRRRTLIVLAALFTALHLAGPFLVPDPRIDNWAWTQAALRALLQGRQPYTLAFSEVPGAQFARDPVSAFPYPPLTLLLLEPAYVLFGDFRVALAAAMPVIVYLTRRLGRALALDAQFIDIATLIVLLNPRSFTATGFGHIEPVMMCGLLVFAWLAVRGGHPGLEALAFSCAPALKQYLIAPAFLFLWFRTRLSWRAIAAAVVAMLVLAAPFFIWNAHATWHGMTLEIDEWLGPDANATSLAALTVRLGWFPGRHFAPVMQLVAGAVFGWRLRGTGLTGFFYSSAMSLLITFLTAWQAFPHYYLLVTMMLLFGTMCLAAHRSNGTWIPPEY